MPHKVLNWEMPTFVHNQESPADEGLSGVAEEELKQCLEPIMQSIRQVDADTLLKLRRTSSSRGARVKDGYVHSCGW
jgi:hypothetical protein